MARVSVGPGSFNSKMKSGDSNSNVTWPSDRELQVIFRQKYGEPHETGWAPRRRWQHGYYLPADVYEALVRNLVFDGCAWIDVGGGSSLFPDNPKLAHALAAKASRIVAVDPSANVLENTHAHERVQTAVENYTSAEQFDLATLRMVVEHVVEPALVVGALQRLLRPGGVAVVFTVNRWSPASIVSKLTPFRVHHLAKKIIWGTEERDTFPVQYRMNTRRALRALFENGGFREVAFSYQDDLSIGGEFRSLNYIELRAWKLLRALRLRYPENCLLGVYQRL